VLRDRKKNRRRDTREAQHSNVRKKKATTLRFNICKQYDHNSGTCQRDNSEQIRGLNDD
jgi:hypothetical protein